MPADPKRRPPLTEAMILSWCDDFHARKGCWPKTTDGRAIKAPGENWLNIDMALRRGSRGLPGGDSLARLLQRERGVRNKARLPRLTEAGVLAWAEAHRRRTGRWPRKGDGPVADAEGEYWLPVNQALHVGLRGLPGGSSLAKLLRNGQARGEWGGKGRT
jgi:hypothetical protein